MLDTVKSEKALEQKNYFFPKSKYKVNESLFTESIHQISVNGIKTLAQHFSPNVVYPLIEDLNQEQSIEAAEILINFKKEIEEDFLSAMTWVYSLCLTRSAEKLVARGIKFLHGEEVGEYIVRCLFEHEREFFELVNKSFSSDLFHNKTYTVLMCKKNAFEISKKKSVSENDLDTTEDAFKKHYASAGCGDYCKLLTSQSESNYGLYIERGGHRSGKAVLNLEDKPCSRRDRPLKTDYGFYNDTSRSLWLSSMTKHEKELFAINMGELIFGDPLAFSLQMTFDLSFLLDDNLNEVLKKSVFGNIVSIKIKNAVMRASNEGRAKTIYPAKRNECLSQNEFFLEGRSQNVDPEELILEIEFKNSKRRDSVVIKESTIKTGNIIKDAELITLLCNLKIMEKVYDA